MYISKPKRTKRIRKSVNNKSELSMALVKNKIKLSIAEVLKIEGICENVKSESSYLNLLRNAMVFSGSREYKNGFMNFCKKEDVPTYYSITSTYAFNFNTVTSLRERRSIFFKSPEFIFNQDVDNIGGSLESYNKYIEMVYKIDDARLLRDTVEERVNKIYNPVIGNVDSAITKHKIVRKFKVISADYVHSPIVTAKLKVIPTALLNKHYQAFNLFPKNKFPFPF